MGAATPSRQVLSDRRGGVLAFCVGGLLPLLLTLHRRGVARVWPGGCRPTAMTLLVGRRASSEGGAVQYVIAPLAAA